MLAVATTAVAQAVAAGMGELFDHRPRGACMQRYCPSCDSGGMSRAALRVRPLAGQSCSGDVSGASSPSASQDLDSRRRRAEARNFQQVSPLVGSRPRWARFSRFLISRYIHTLEDSQGLQSPPSSVVCLGGPARPRRAPDSTTHSRPDLQQGPLRPAAHTAVAPRSAPRAPLRPHAAALCCPSAAIKVSCPGSF